MTSKTHKIITVYVTGYEGNNKSAISGWDWFINKKPADTQYNVYENLPKVLPYRGEIQLELPINYDVASKLNTEEINGIVENFLGEHDWENSFKTKHPVVKWVE